jgi:hypothetical protein
MPGAECERAAFRGDRNAGRRQHDLDASAGGAWAKDNASSTAADGAPDRCDKSERRSGRLQSGHRSHGHAQRVLEYRVRLESDRLGLPRDFAGGVRGRSMRPYDREIRRGPDALCSRLVGDVVRIDGGPCDLERAELRTNVSGCVLERERSAPEDGVVADGRKGDEATDQSQPAAPEPQSVEKLNCDQKDQNRTTVDVAALTRRDELRPKRSQQSPVHEGGREQGEKPRRERPAPGQAQREKTDSPDQKHLAPIRAEAHEGPECSCGCARGV